MENTQGRGRQQRGTEVTELRDTFDFYLKVLAACSHGLNEDGKGNTGRNIAIKKKKKKSNPRTFPKTKRVCHDPRVQCC